MKVFKVEENSIKLSKFLSDKYGASMPYSTMQKLFRAKDIKVDGKRVSKDLTVQKGQEICVYFDGVKNEITPLFNKCGILVFFKPRTITSEDFEVEINKTYQGYKLCHRLDRNTAGLLVFGIEKSLEEMLSAFKKRTIQKFYLAEVYGALEKDSDTLTSYLVKNAENSLVKIYDKKVEGSVKIVTKYEVVEKRKNSTVIRVELITGKTHQIRAHFAHIGHFVIGDGKYGSNEINKLFKAKRQRLTAYSLTFNFEKDSPLYSINGETITLDNNDF